MFRFARAFLFFSTLLSSFLHTQAQSVETEVRTGTGSISGVVTVRGKPIENIAVSLAELNRGGQRASRESGGEIKPELYLNTTTNAIGQYRFSNLPAATYRIAAVSGVFVMAESEAGEGKLIDIDDGEAKGDLNFALIRGGVITGRVTDSAGKPLIAAQIHLRFFFNLAGTPDPDSHLQVWRSSDEEMLQTDDRGVYRIYGLPKGRYIVGAGGETNSHRANQVARDHSLTWCPGVIDQKQARVLEIDDSNEITDADIKFGASVKTYAALGRVVEAETGAPVAMASISCHKTDSVDNDFRQSYSQTDAQGRFRLSGLTNGTYALYCHDSRENHQFYFEETTFVISDGDIPGLDLKANRGGSISGMVAFEGAVDQQLREHFKTYGLYSQLIQKTAGRGARGGASSTKIEADGRFHITGLPPGKLTFQPMRVNSLALYPLRIEQNGAEVRDGIDVGAGQKISGIRVIFAEGKGVIRGQVRVTGGALPENAETDVMAAPVTQDNATSSHSTGQTGFAYTDGKGRFLIEGLKPGEYELWVNISIRRGANSVRSGFYNPRKPEQRVSVTSGAETNVTINIDVSKIEGERPQ